MPTGQNSLTTLADLYREDYEDALKVQFNESNKFHKLLTERRAGKVTPSNGEYFQHMLVTQRNHAVASGSETATLPAVGRRAYTATKFYRAHMRGTWGVTGAALDAAKNGGIRGLANLMDSHMRGLGKDVTNYMNRCMLHGVPGFVGCLAVPISASNDTPNSGQSTLTLLSQGNQAIASPAVTDSAVWLGSTQLERGMQVMVLTRAAGNVNSVGVASAEVVSFTGGANPQVVLSANMANAGSVTTAYGIYPLGSWSATDGTGTQTDPYGLMTIASTANPGSAQGTDPNGYYGGINRSTVTEWQSIVLSNSGVLRAPTVDLLEQLMNEIEIASGMKPTHLWCNHATRRKIAALHIADRRFQGSAKSAQNVELGYGDLYFDDVPIIAERQFPPHTVAASQEDCLELLVERELSAMDEDGQVLVRTAARTDAYEGAAIWRGQLACAQPNSCGVLKDLTN